jgi:hypothetical protein
MISPHWLWKPANNGHGARMWFLCRDDSVPVSFRWHCNASGNLVRYGSYGSAKKAAEKLNAEKPS